MASLAVLLAAMAGGILSGLVNAIVLIRRDRWRRQRLRELSVAVASRPPAVQWPEDADVHVRERLSRLNREGRPPW